MSSAPAPHGPGAAGSSAEPSVGSPASSSSLPDAPRRRLPLLIDPAAPANPPLGRRDLLVAAGYAILVVLLAVSGAHNTGFLATGAWSREVSVALMLVGCVSLIWRRRRPAVTLAVAGPLSLAEIAAGGQISAYFLLFEALFDPVMHGSRALAAWTIRISIAASVVGIVVVLVVGVPGPMVFVIGLVIALVVLTPLLWGWEVRHHRGARQAAEQLAELEHELAAVRTVHAVEAERRSIAHDLHDVIAGHLSAVSLHTNLASSLEDRAARDRSLRTARESAHAALRDLRSMIGVLSAEEAGALPEVTLDWPSLSARLRGRDPEAQVSIDPAATAPARVEPSVQAALLRIAAEATTNAVRHGAAPISLDVRVGAESVTLELVNRRAERSAPGTGVGRGAIAHRATAVGGSAWSSPGAADEPSAAEPPATGPPMTGQSATGRSATRRPADPSRPEQSPIAPWPAETWLVRAQLPVRADAAADHLTEEPRP